MAADSKGLPSPPFIRDMPDIPNFRSIGSHTSAIDGRLTRSDYVFRCGAPTGISEQTLSTIELLGISTFYDLRSEQEIENLKKRTPITNIPGTQRVFCPVFIDRDSSPRALAERLASYAEQGPHGFVRAYSEILTAGSNDGAYRTIFEHIRDFPTKNLAIHCTAGKDRTGVVVALMLNLVGVDDEVVGDEYALTEIGLREEVEKWIPLMLQNPAYANDRDAVRRSLSARKDSMIETLKMLRTKWGGAEGYLKDALAFSKTDIDKIKENLLEK